MQVCNTELFQGGGKLLLAYLTELTGKWNEIIVPLDALHAFACSISDLLRSMAFARVAFMVGPCRNKLSSNWVSPTLARMIRSCPITLTLLASNYGNFFIGQRISSIVTAMPLAL